VSLLRRGSDGDKPGCGFQDSPGALECFATNGVKDNIHHPSLILKTASAVVNHLLGAQAANEFKVVR
jgi:hypothetical protein